MLSQFVQIKFLTCIKAVSSYCKADLTVFHKGLIVEAWFAGASIFCNAQASGVSYRPVIKVMNLWLFWRICKIPPSTSWWPYPVDSVLTRVSPLCFVQCL